MTRFEAFKQAFENLSINDKVALYNEMGENYDYDHIFDIDEFDEMNEGQSPFDLARMIYYGDFCPAHSYWWYNGYGNFESSDFPTQPDDNVEDIYEGANWEATIDLSDYDIDEEDE